MCFRRDGKSLERFVDDYLAGRLKPYVKSEPVPERNVDAVKVTPELFPLCVPPDRLSHLQDCWPVLAKVDLACVV